MKKQLLILAAVFAVAFQSNAQRYLSEIFTSVNVQSNVVYGNNVSILTGTPTPFDLKMDVYTPVGDTLSERPVVIVCHTGSMLPAILNQTPTGSMRDSAIAEMCRQFARRGYVAISADYRTGWNPQAVGPAGQDIRTGTLLQAVYRGIQDIKACVRYLRMDYEMMGNTYGIDTSRIILGGMGTGGYISLAYATVQDSAEYNLPKFISATTNPTYGFVAGKSYVLNSLWGDIDGYGGTPGLNNPNNNPGYSNRIHFVFNCGGAMGDSSWLEAGDVPMVCFHPTTDPFAPYTDGTVIVPTTGDPVVDVSGSYTVMRKVNEFDNNLCYRNAGFTDPYTTRANAVNDGYEGLFPFALPSPQAGPWEWFDSTTTVNVAIALGLGSAAGTQIYQNALLTNPDMRKAKALAYIDTIQNYLNPRIDQCLGLTTGVSNIDLNRAVEVYPNPAVAEFYVMLNEVASEVKSITLSDITGKTVMTRTGSMSLRERFETKDLTSGIYMLNIRTDKGSAVKRVVVK